MWTAAASVAIAIGLGLASPAWAQQSPGNFLIPENWDGDSILPEDRLVPRDAAGDLQGFGGAAWWQALAFCAGSLRAASTSGALPTGVSPDLLQRSSIQFEEAAILRLQEDRGVSRDLASEILASDIEFQVAVAAEQQRAVAADMARCDAVRMGNGHASRP